ncbi:MAG: beta-propeller domain-containing protein, partial [Thermoproteota archaeon]
GSHSFVTVIAINVQDESTEPAYKTFLAGTSDVIYMSHNNMYIAQNIWRATSSSGQIGVSIIPSIKNNQGYEMTVIHKLHVDGLNIEYVARGEARGFPLNQFSMDEYGGFFRIATTSHADYEMNSILKEVNNIYVFDPDMNLIGALEDLAPGERIHSARFLGDLCYLVTFKKVDPLFVIDMASPSEPKVMGKLKIPGYSDYLHPFGEGFLIGVGKETVEAEEGDFAWYQGLKISLFDVRKLDDPKEVSKLIIGDRGTDSPVLYDHRAFLLDMRRGVLVLPILVAEIDRSDYPSGVPPNAYGEFTWQGVYVLNVSLDGGIEVRGRITHMDDRDDLLKSGFYFYSESQINRAIYIGDVLYTISGERIKASDLSTLEQISTISLKK